MVQLVVERATADVTLAMRVERPDGERHELRAFNEVSLLRQTHQAAKLRISIDGTVRLDSITIQQPGPGISALIADALSGALQGDEYEARFEDVADYTFAEISMAGFSADFSDEEETGTFAIRELTLSALWRSPEHWEMNPDPT